MLCTDLLVLIRTSTVGGLCGLRLHRPSLSSLQLFFFFFVIFLGVFISACKCFVIYFVLSGLPSFCTYVLTNLLSKTFVTGICFSSTVLDQLLAILPLQQSFNNGCCLYRFVLSLERLGSFFFWIHCLPFVLIPILPFSSRF